MEWFHCSGVSTVLELRGFGSAAVLNSLWNTLDFGLVWIFNCAGDEIDATCHEEMQEIVGLAGSPENAFSLFFDIVKNLFEWDEQGGGT